MCADDRRMRADQRAPDQGRRGDGAGSPGSPFRPGAARTLDLDLVLFGDEIINEPNLIVPHPRFRERRFVLQPLAEIAADLKDPVTGKRVGELLRALGELA